MESKGVVSGFELAKKEDFEKFKEEASKESKEDGWEIQLDKKGLKVMTKCTKDSPINILKLVAEVPLPMNSIYNVLHDPEYRKTWDENMIEGFLIEKLDAYNDVGYYAAKSPVWTISNRDFCNIRSWYTPPDDSERVIINHSVPHPKCPEKKGFVRANSILTGYWLRPFPGDDSKTILIYMTRTDPGGWIPAWVVNSTASTFAPKIIENITRVSEKYDDWKAKHNPEAKPWLSTDPYFWEEKK
jgi:hypothetical protein